MSLPDECQIFIDIKDGEGKIFESQMSPKDQVKFTFDKSQRLFFEKTETNCHTNVVFFITLFAIYNKTAYFCIEKNEKDKTHLLLIL